MAFLSCGHLPTVDCDFCLLPKIGSAMLEGRSSESGPCAWARFPTILLPVTAIFRGTGCAVSARGLGCQAFGTVLGSTAVLQLCSHLPRPRCNAAVLRIQRV